MPKARSTKPAGRARPADGGASASCLTARTAAMVAVVAIFFLGQGLNEEREASECKFTYIKSGIAGAGRGLYTLAPLTAGQRCCSYDGEDFAQDDTSEAAMEKRLHPEYNQEHPSGGFRAGYVPPRTSCGVAQLANDAHRIELSHPTRLSVVVQVGKWA